MEGQRARATAGVGVVVICATHGSTTPQQPQQPPASARGLLAHLTSREAHGDDAELVRLGEELALDGAGVHGGGCDVAARFLRGKEGLLFFFRCFLGAQVIAVVGPFFLSTTRMTQGSWLWKMPREASRGPLDSLSRSLQWGKCGCRWYKVGG